MLPDGRRLGAHLPLGAGMVRAVERAHAIGASAIQVFSDNPTSWRRRPGPPKELPAFRRRIADFDIGPLAIHAPYLINLAGPDQVFFERSVDVIVHELRIARLFGAQFVNVHIGSHRGAGEAFGTERVAEALETALSAAAAGSDPIGDGASESVAHEGSDPVGDGISGIEANEEDDPPAWAAPSDPIVVLENSAGGGYGLGATVEELGGILDAITRRGIARDRIGFCLDTAHAWGAGYEISRPGELDALLSSFDERIGLDRLLMVHLNDSKAPLGAHVDRHQHVGAGEIGAVGMAHVLRHPRLAHVAYYCETPGMDEGYDEVNVRRAIDLAAGRPVGQLPLKALKLKGSRARSAPAKDS